MTFASLLTFQDKVGSWYSNPGTGTTESGTVGGGGGVGKYLKARNSRPEAATVDTGISTVDTVKKRKVGISTAEFKDFSGW